MGVISIEEYVQQLNDNGKRYVSEFVGFMKNEYPELVPKISFSMPMWLIGKKMSEGYIAISAAKNHFSIHFSDEEYVKNLSKSIPSCKAGKRCINIKYGDDKSFQRVRESAMEFLNKM